MIQWLFNRYSTPLLIVLSGILFISPAQENIRINQSGFYLFGPKAAVIVSPQTWYFTIRSTDLEKTFYSGELSPQQTWSKSGEDVKVADFSDFTTEGTFVVYVNGVGASYPFTIRKDPHSAVSRDIIRAFYYQRASTALPAQYAGVWSREAGHPDKSVKIHFSAASDPTKPNARKAGESYAAPKGWYDAGDYGKYVVNSGITTYTMLLLYQQFSSYFDTLFLNIPESGNMLPDFLSEIKWQLDWLLAMQDPADGGVYHKLTGLNFLGDVKPSDAKATRYFIGKGSCATFDFVAVCAMASRVYRDFLPSFADSLLEAAQYAWSWGSEYPDSIFKNPSDVVTGEYGDNRSSDEHTWAAFEMFLATEDSAYYNTAKLYAKSFGVPDWRGVGILGYYSMALSGGDSVSKASVIRVADILVNKVNTLPYHTSISTEFYWGSNGVVANQGMLMLIAYLISKDCNYLEGAVHALDYLMGRNATGYCFVTGAGYKSPMNPHHRPSISDGVYEPVPGFLVGGPNSQIKTGETCLGNYPVEDAKVYLDHSCSFTTNEVAINWNAPAAFLASGLEVAFNNSDFDIQDLYSKYSSDTIAPKSLSFVISDTQQDKAAIYWKTEEPVVVTIEYDTVSNFSYSKKIIMSSIDSTQLVLFGLIPSQKYHIRCSFIDNSGNFSVDTGTFTTLNSPLFSTSLYRHTVSEYKTGKDLQISFADSIGIAVSLLYCEGGTLDTSKIAFTENSGQYSAIIPGEDVTISGLLYSILLIKGTDTLLTPQWAIAPDSVSLTNNSFTVPKTYSLTSLPLKFSSVPACTAFGEALGNTSKWRFYGYEPDSNSYILFDTLRSGFGGWLYHEEKRSFTHNAQGLKPDTLFPVTLKKGWNCIGNPFPFPIYWDNLLVKNKSALMRISDTAASLLVRRQFFTYKDSLIDKKINGAYLSNRNLFTNVFNDSASILPWQAFWVYAEKDSVTCLFNPAATRNKSLLGKKQNLAQKYWTCVFKASSGDLSDISVFGANENAHAGYDMYDSPKPPAISSGLQIGFSNPEWEKHDDLYISDMVNLRKGSHQWILKVRYSRKELVTLKWEKSGISTGQLILRDSETGAAVDMSNSSSYTFTPKPGELAREMAVSWTEEINPVLNQVLNSWSFTTEKTGLYSVVKLRYTVPYSIQNEAFVNVGIYDIRGRSIASLVREQKRPGKYVVNWNGTNSQGQMVAKGTYLARFKTPAFSETRILNIAK